MDMLDPSSPLPLYHQVKTALAREIAAGAYAPHQAIPPERELIQRFGVSRITIRQALAELVSEGTLYRRQGKGTYVAAPRHGPISESLAQLTGHLEELHLRGLNPQVAVLQFDRRPLPPDVAAALHQAPGAEGWYLHRMVAVDGLPLMLTEIYLPDGLGFEPTEPLMRLPMSRLLAEHGHRPDRGHQRIGACTASPDEAKLLEVEPGAALLRVVRVIATPAGRPLVWFRTLYRADRYEYEVDLTRRR